MHFEKEAFDGIFSAVGALHDATLYCSVHQLKASSNKTYGRHC